MDNSEPDQNGLVSICNDGRQWGRKRHGMKANCGMVDGHVETHTENELLGLIDGGYYWWGYFMGPKGINNGNGAP